jgi:hypothetical protein
MATYWHPLLAQFLRRDYGDRLIIEEEVNLGDMPLRVDLLLIRRYPAVPLPYPFSYLGTTTLVSFKGPHDSAAQAALQELEIYGLLYQQRANVPRRRDVTLWLVASKYAPQVSWREGAYLARAQDVGPGVRAGSLSRFPTCLVNLNELPVDTATWPLVMVSRGPAEQQLVEYFLDHQAELSQDLPKLIELHWQRFLEVITMRELTLEELGIEDVDEYIQAIMKIVGSDERVVHALIQKLGAERLQQIVQRAIQEQSPPPQDQGSKIET